MPSRIHVVGVGPAGPPPAAATLARAADLVIGAGRHLDLLRRNDGGRPEDGTAWIPLGALGPALEAIASCDGEVLVLASGDPGFFGIVRTLASRFGSDALAVTPAVSSVAAAFAHLGLPWDDVVVVSAHGRDSRPAVAAALAGGPVAVLTAPDFTPADLGARLAAAGAADRRLVIAERLGAAGERLVEVRAGEAAGPYADPNLVVVLPDGSRRVTPGPRTICNPRSAPTRWALPVDDFDHRDGMISKPEVRALALAHLGPATGRLVWDVGAGCGSVAVECARFGAAVIAVEDDAEEVERCRRNAAAHDVGVRVVAGTAPAVLEGLPDADAAFVGGGGTALPAILDIVAARTRDRVAVALAAVERVAGATTLLRDAGWDVRAQLVQVHDVAPLGGSTAAHRLAPRNPVWLVTADRQRTEDDRHG